MQGIFQQITAPLYRPILAMDCTMWVANTHNDIFMRTAERHKHNPALDEVWPKAVTKGADKMLAKGWWGEFVEMTSWITKKPELMAGVNSGHIHDACAQMPKNGAVEKFITLCRNISHRPDLMDSITPDHVHRVAKGLLQDEWGGYHTYLVQPLQAAVAAYPALANAIRQVPETERMVTYSAAQSGYGGPIVAIANPKTDNVDFFVPHDGKQNIKQLFDRHFMYPRSSPGHLIVFQALDKLTTLPAAATAATRALNNLAQWGSDDNRWLLGRNHDKIKSILKRHAQPVAG